MSFSEVLKKKRIEAGMRQADLAEKLGISRGYVSDLERGLYQPSLSTAIKIARLLEIDINILKKNDGNTIQRKEGNDE